MTDTSKLAYDSILPHASRLAQDVFARIADAGSHGATCDELECILDMRHQTCSARIRELKDKRVIRDSGRRRETRSGRYAAVLVSNTTLSGCDHDRNKWIDSLVEKRYGWLRTECRCGQFIGYRDKRNDVKNDDYDI